MRASLHRLFWLTVYVAISLPAHATNFEWDNVERIVAIGDIHGDYGAFVAVLRDAKVINKRNRWIGGKTHLVQVGDIPDRGPDSRKSMDLLRKLEKQALKAGGVVHALIGNHEAMNMQGDLRYVHPGEYQAFTDRRSRKRQQDYYLRTLDYLRGTLKPEDLPIFDDAYKENWHQRFPLGYVEHRLSWLPSNRYGKWVLGHNAVIKINDTLFVHGGISPKYLGQPLQQINDHIREELKLGEQFNDGGSVTDPDGPLWYRGLSSGPETCEVEQHLSALLETYQVKRIVVAHTPLAGAIFPRYNRRVILVDVGLSAHYGGARAALLIEGDQISAVHNGTRIPLSIPVQDYFREAYSLSKGAPLLEKFIKNGTLLEQSKPLDCAAEHTTSVTIPTIP